ncbi:hypothetical protein EZJ55_03900 [Microcystis aeruginosa EAWAG127a]|uniref:Uncharacterized protein n=1 Tax=Microcystis aeruginosa EAWAG127a TaxID=2529855 RepID=A0A5J5LR70_MICAE|nr:hypothetical protein EZJ55_03900 [Microcystis aeruginosa EAWAG127a]
MSEVSRRGPNGKRQEAKGGINNQLLITGFSMNSQNLRLCTSQLWKLLYIGAIDLCVLCVSVVPSTPSPA